jgi:acetyltransferase
MNAALDRCHRVTQTRDGIAYRIRPIRVDDALRERAFIMNLSEASRYNRMMDSLREPSTALIEQFVNVDYRRTMAIVATVGDGKDESIIGVARYAADADAAGAEFAVAVADEWQSRGVGTTLMRMLFEYARAQGLRRLYGPILASNERMLGLAHWLGMKTKPVADDYTLVEAYQEL